VDDGELFDFKIAITLYTLFYYYNEPDFLVIDQTPEIDMIWQKEIDIRFI
jgi:hypothetical protein